MIEQGVSLERLAICVLKLAALKPAATEQPDFGIGPADFVDRDVTGEVKIELLAVIDSHDRPAVMPVLRQLQGETAVDLHAPRPRVVTRILHEKEFHKTKPRGRSRSLIPQS